MSCTNADNCTAVGDDWDSQPIYATESDGTWGPTIEVPGAPSPAIFWGVSCTGVGACTAVGTDGNNQPIYANETGGTWGQATEISGTPGGEGGLSAVSCTSSENCTAVGHDANDKPVVASEGGCAGQTERARIAPGPYLAVPSSGSCPPPVGIYADFNTIGSVTQAASDGWGLIASVAGRGCTKNLTICPPKDFACAPESYVHPTGSDLAVERGLNIQGSPQYPAWISYWTPAVPAVGVSLYRAGRLAAVAAGRDIETAASMVTRPSTPVYVSLDFEGSPAEISCGNDVTGHAKKNGDKQCWGWGSKKPRNCRIVPPAGWKEFALGWEAGILASKSPLTLTPAIYVNSGEYKPTEEHGEGAGSWGLPVIIAIDPIIRKSVPQGPSIVGYAAFDDPALAPCDHAQEYIKEVKAWGGISTIQFSQLNAKGRRVNTVYCKP